MKKISFKNYDEAKVHAPSTFSEFIFYEPSQINVEASVVHSEKGFLISKDFSANLHCYGSATFKDHLFLLFPYGEPAMLNGVNTNKISCYVADSAYHFISSQPFNAFILACHKDIVKESHFHSKVLLDQNCYWRNKDLCCSGVRDDLSEVLQSGSFSDKILKSLVGDIFEYLSSTSKFKTEKCGDKLVKEVFAYIWENRMTQLFIYEICDIFNMPRRTLEYNYRRFFKISPGQHIKYIKLGLVRQMLLSKKVGVGDIIYSLEDLGIHHPGHFGQMYKSYFGESMSETLT